MKDIIRKLEQGAHLSTTEIESVMKAIMDGKADDEEIKAYLLALNLKGPTVEEITASARSMRRFLIPVRTGHQVVLDTCGTGGDGKETFNISTVTAFVVAGAGVTVAKHGNRSVSSRCGSACVLEALGVSLDLDEKRTGQCLDRIGISFLFAQRLHPAMKNVAPVRKELGVKTIFNILGPLCNPANATHQILGVYSRDLVEPMAFVLKNLGLRRSLVVHGSDGLDEITTTGKSFVAEFDSKGVMSYDIDPAELGIPKARVEDLRGGSVEDNARIVRELLAGAAGPRRDIVVLNAAYALYAAEMVTNINDGLAMAAKSIDSGSARRKLDELVSFTNDG